VIVGIPSDTLPAAGINRYKDRKSSWNLDGSNLSSAMFTSPDRNCAILSWWYPAPVFSLENFHTAFANPRTLTYVTHQHNSLASEGVLRSCARERDAARWTPVSRIPSSGRSSGSEEILCAASICAVLVAVLKDAVD
jgi:hypothetical protein